MMFDGSLRRVEDVLPGELLMGPDSTPRRVLELAGGAGPMVEIRPTKGQPWTVNLDHVLTLVRTPTHPRRPYPSGQGGALVDVTVREWLRWSAHRKHTHKLLRVAVDFPPSAPVPVSPWVIGLMLGDGSLSRRNAAEFTNVDAEVIEEARREAAVMGLRLTSYKPKNRASCHRFSGAIGRSENYLTARLRGLGLLGISCENRFIPHEYKTASRADRLRLLAGLMDSDGHGVRGGYDYTSKSRYLADDVAFVARSLGLAAYVKQCRKGCQAGAVGTYYRVSISGDCAAVPCVMAKKRHGVRRQKKNVLRVGFVVRQLAEPERFYGFCLDKDRRYLLDDFSVTHNTGKTRTFAEVARRRMAAGPVLVIAHRSELIDQAVAALHVDTGSLPHVEKAEQRAPEHAAIVVATVQSLKGRRLGRWDVSHFKTVIVDEAHHAVAAGYRSIVSQFSSAKVLGVTATPDRTDEEALGQVFESVAYEYGVEQAVADGWLCDIVCKQIHVADFDVSQVRTTRGDLDEGDLDAALCVDGTIHKVCAPLVQEAGTRPTIVFAPRVASAHAIADVLSGYVGKAVGVIDGNTDRVTRGNVIAAFREGRMQFLVNCQVLTEGFDAPETACIAVARPTKSRALYAQMVGRGTRIAPGKENLLVLDFYGNSGRHKLVSAIDIFDGKMTEEVRALAVKFAADGTLTGDAVKAAREAAAKRARESAERDALYRAKQRHQAQVAYSAKFVDPFGIMPKDGGRWGAHDEQASEAQVEFLRKLGVDKIDRAPNKRQAGKLISELKMRRVKGLCTFKQARLLAKNGLRHDLSFVQAGEAITELAGNGWRVTPDMRVRYG